MSQTVKMLVAATIAFLLGLALGEATRGSVTWSFFRDNAFFIPETIQIGILFGILYQANLLLRENERNHVREKQKSTLDFILSIWSVYETPRRELDLRFGAAKVTFDEMALKDRLHLVTLLNCMNIVGAGIKRGALDKNLISDLYATHFISLGSKYEDFIKLRQSELGADPWEFYSKVRNDFIECALGQTDGRQESASLSKIAALAATQSPDLTPGKNQSNDPTDQT